jgi:uncharacterized membrane protein
VTADVHPEVDQLEDVTEGVKPLPPRPRIFELRFSGFGFLVAGFFFAWSMTPSLLPRAAIMQGLIIGITSVIGYGLGASIAGVWHYLQIPVLRGRVRTIVAWVSIVLIVVLAATLTWRYIGWQNEQRAAFGMPAVGVGQWPTMAIVAVLVFTLLLLIARVVRHLTAWIIRGLQHLLPRRLAIVLGVVVILGGFWLLYSGVLVDSFFSAANSIYAPKNNTNKPGVTNAPRSDLRSGGPGSLVSWASLGREGRSFVSTGPTEAELSAASPGWRVLEPIRVYAGTKSAPTVQGRADLVLAELKRTHAFDRRVLILATTTGSGFIEPEGIDPIEYLWHGDTAVAAIQYSYLPSWLSLLADQAKAQQASQATFDTVYSYWRTLPSWHRPKLYLYGLSLGSFGAQSVLGSFELLNQPINGALLVGPPFVNPLHARLTDQRDSGSPAWRPIYKDGHTARFTVQQPTLLSLPGQSAGWGPMRLAYLQYGSDPVVFFSPQGFFSTPAWLEGQRAPDVSPRLRWFPIVTGWQTLFDLANAGGVPFGYGHRYAASDNLMAWYALTSPRGWSQSELSALGQHLNSQYVK